jgi:hypothetical protein
VRAICPSNLSVLNVIPIEIGEEYILVLWSFYLRIFYNILLLPLP